MHISNEGGHPLGLIYSILDLFHGPIYSILKQSNFSEQSESAGYGAPILHSGVGPDGEEATCVPGTTCLGIAGLLTRQVQRHTIGLWKPFDCSAARQ